MESKRFIKGLGICLLVNFFFLVLFLFFFLIFVIKMLFWGMDFFGFSVSLFEEGLHPYSMLELGEKYHCSSLYQIWLDEISKMENKREELEMDSDQGYFGDEALPYLSYKSNPLELRSFYDKVIKAYVSSSNKEDLESKIFDTLSDYVKENPKPSLSREGVSPFLIGKGLIPDYNDSLKDEPVKDVDLSEYSELIRLNDLIEKRGSFLLKMDLKDLELSKEEKNLLFPGIWTDFLKDAGRVDKKNRLMFVSSESLRLLYNWIKLNEYHYKRRIYPRLVINYRDGPSRDRSGDYYNRKEHWTTWKHFKSTDRPLVYTHYHIPRRVPVSFMDFYRLSWWNRNLVSTSNYKENLRDYQKNVRMRVIDYYLERAERKYFYQLMSHIPDLDKYSEKKKYRLSKPARSRWRNTRFPYGRAKRKTLWVRPKSVHLPPANAKPVDNRNIIEKVVGVVKNMRDNSPWGKGGHYDFFKKKYRHVRGSGFNMKTKEDTVREWFEGRLRRKLKAKARGMKYYPKMKRKKKRWKKSRFHNRRLTWMRRAKRYSMAELRMRYRIKPWMRALIYNKSEHSKKDKLRIAEGRRRRLFKLKYWYDDERNRKYPGIARGKGSYTRLYMNDFAPGSVVYRNKQYILPKDAPGYTYRQLCRLKLYFLNVHARIYLRNKELDRFTFYDKWLYEKRSQVRTRTKRKWSSQFPVMWGSHKSPYGRSIYFTKDYLPANFWVKSSKGIRRVWYNPSNLPSKSWRRDSLFGKPYKRYYEYLARRDVPFMWYKKTFFKNFKLCNSHLRSNKKLIYSGDVMKHFLNYEPLKEEEGELEKEEELEKEGRGWFTGFIIPKYEDLTLRWIFSYGLKGIWLESHFGTYLTVLGSSIVFWICIYGKLLLGSLLFWLVWLICLFFTVFLLFYLVRKKETVLEDLKEKEEVNEEEFVYWFFKTNYRYKESKYDWSGLSKNWKSSNFYALDKFYYNMYGKTLFSFLNYYNDSLNKDKSGFYKALVKMLLILIILNSGAGILFYIFYNSITLLV